MKLKKRIASLLAAALIIINVPFAGFAAENAGIAVKVYPETAKIGETVTVTVSLSGYDESAVPIRGIQVDMTAIDESVLTISSKKSLIDDTVNQNSVSELADGDNKKIRLLYAKQEGTLPQPHTDILQVGFTVNSTLTEDGSITLPLTIRIRTTEGNVTLQDNVAINYSVEGEITPPEMVSLDIRWGTMDFTYTDGAWDPQTHTYGAGSWNDNGTGYVKITNTGTIETAAEITFTSEKEEIRGTIKDGETVITGPVNLESGEEKTANLILEGKPLEEMTSVKIGSITVKIGGE